MHPIPGALDFDQAANLLGNYETAYHCLVARGRLEFDADAAAMRADVLSTGIQELALGGPTAIAAAALDLHPDPADRFIAATAVVHDAALITADERLLAWKHPLKRHDARR